MGRLSTSSDDYLYFTEQPYGRVLAFETGFPVIDSSSAAFDVVGRTGDIIGIRRRFAVDRAFVDDLSFRIDDEHVRSVLAP